MNRSFVHFKKMDFAVRIVLTKLALLLTLALTLFDLCSARTPTTPSASDIQFVDITKSAGITWNLRTLAPGTKYLVETMGGGGGFIDYNNDGLLDIYLVCYSQTPQAEGASKLTDVLYRNNGDGTFTDVTDKAGIGIGGMVGMGLAVGDYDNDGWPDIYITGFRSSRLFHNNHNGTFSDVTRHAGVDNNQWGTSAAFFDYDNDGYLDLYVCNYLQFDSDEKTACTLYDDKPYCYIAKMKGSKSKLFHNNRDGTFTDVSEKAKIGITGKGLGIVAFDYNNDGRIDIFQANDTTANFLFRNNGDGTFSEVALEAGVAYDTNGHARGGMGADAADIDGDGNQEIFVTNFSGETNALFHNDGDGLFTETTFKQGLGEISIPMSGFGTRFFDYNNDGLIDLFVLNGHPFEPINKIFPQTTYAEPPFLFENTGNGFREVASQHGDAFKKLYPGRGVAVADFDNDGDSDLLLINIGQPPVLLRNDGGNKNHWLGIKLTGVKSNRDGIGAKVTVTAGGKSTTKQLLGGTSYCSASDQRLLFGLGATAKVDQVEIRWPSGQVDRLKNLSVDRYVNIKENTVSRDK